LNKEHSEAISLLLYLFGIPHYTKIKVNNEHRTLYFHLRVLLQQSPYLL
jgi:hypothetical protein